MMEIIQGMSWFGLSYATNGDLSVSMYIVGHKKCQLTFANIFPTLRGKFAIEWLLNIQTHLDCVA